MTVMCIHLFNRLTWHQCYLCPPLSVASYWQQWNGGDNGEDLQSLLAGVSRPFLSLSVCLCCKFAVLVGSLCTNLWDLAAEACTLSQMLTFVSCCRSWLSEVKAKFLTHTTVLVSASQGLFEQVITAEPAPVVTYLCYNVSKFKIEF